MRTESLQPAELTKNRSQVISAGRMPMLIANFALILFSSTKTAGDASQYAFRFYRALLKLSHKSALMGGLLAPKFVHFVLFFSLGVWLVHSLKLSPRERLAITAALCLLVGIASETLQILTGRDASMADVILNFASGGLAAAVLVRETMPADRTEVVEASIQ